jgi:hypothetical protein
MRLPQFTIRDLMWLIALMACNLGWYVNKVVPVKELQKKVADQQWEIAFHRNQVAIERKAMRESSEFSAQLNMRAFKLETENNRLQELLSRQSTSNRP